MWAQGKRFMDFHVKCHHKSGWLGAEIQGYTPMLYEITSQMQHVETVTSARQARSLSRKAMGQEQPVQEMSKDWIRLVGLGDIPEVPGRHTTTTTTTMQPRAKTYSPSTTPMQIMLSCQVPKTPLKAWWCTMAHQTPVCTPSESPFCRV